MRAEHMFVRCNCIRIKDEILRVFFFCFFFLCFFFFFFLLTVPRPLHFFFLCVSVATYVTFVLSLCGLSFL